MKMTKLSLLMITSFVLTGCSILPYHNDFACKLEDGYGKCISSDDAYTEATTGSDMGHAITEDGVQNDPKESAAKNAAVADTSRAPATPAYTSYRDRVYEQTAKLIDAPQTPVVRQPTVVRTLILSYSPGLDEQTAYMPRYVFTMLNGPKFVLTDYQLSRDDAAPSFLMGGKG
ncbi:TraV family lipoprotein (plasmid) [Escherichia coli]|jgi:conjugal transfer pilus assembly protein TraV|nr:MULTISPECIES: TraV family lipoprotein [Enterobacteriaceae]ECS2560839.1 type IV conjugative transfer system protein TraV [Salmonella enterica subsp. enterica serovar Meleagridis]EFO3054177.1 type IV conjugative transfer system protein TraV [Escherichia coli O32]EGD8758578.1 type IV conjugative transfer system protein TraV [Shigella flexneri]EGF2699575.1 TraV family lipoprotein [Shigella sonnei]ELH2435902.1 TraV family lipoprotein [Salmonella enterica subsp. enterica serovar Brandenburg]ELV0